MEASRLGVTTQHKVLLWSDSAKLIKAASEELRPHHLEVEAARANEGMFEQVRRMSSSLVLIDLEMGGLTTEQISAWLHELRDAGAAGPKVLMLLRATSEPRLRELFRIAPTNFLAIGNDEQVDSRELLATVQKILSPDDIFGIERYLAPNAVQKVIRVRDSREKNAVVEAVAAYAAEVGCNNRVTQGLAVVADELVTNCVYNAPTRDDGSARYASLARTIPVTLEESEAAELRMAFDGKKFCISAVDPFGSLPPVKVIDYLAKCFRKGDDQIDAKEGGAGLGLYKLFTLLQHFVVNIDPGKRTETIGLIEVTRSYREFAMRPKSFNLFVAGNLAHSHSLT